MKKVFFLAVLLMSFLNPLNINGIKPDPEQNMVNNVMILTDKNFSQSIKHGIVMVDFYADWCGPCKILAPIIEEIALEMNKKVKVGKLDTDKNRLTSVKYNIKLLPTVMIFKNGEPVKKLVGLQNKEYYVDVINNL